MPSVQTGRRAQINSNRSVRDHNQKRPCKTNMTRRYRRYHLLHLLRAEVHGWETSSDHMCISRVCSSLLVCINQWIQAKPVLPGSELENQQDGGHEVHTEPQQSQYKPSCAPSSLACKMRSIRFNSLESTASKNKTSRRVESYGC